MRVIVLGAGDAFGSGGRRQSSYLVQSRSSTFLMDAGPTTLAALKDARVSPADVDFVVLSHLHGDHFGGIPFLILEYMYETRRSRELVVAGPVGTEERVHSLYRAMYLENSEKELTFPLRFLTLEAGRPIELSGVPIEPFAVPHQIREPSLGLKIRLDGKVIVYSGDSGWTEDFVPRTADADLFLCECCYWQTEVDFHNNYPELERQRARIKAKRLILSHLGSEVLEKLDQLAIEYAYDGMVIEV